MNAAKEFYKTYLADDKCSRINFILSELIIEQDPVHVLEFGCGTGKNLWLLNNKGISTAGIDISFINVVHSRVRNECGLAMVGDDTHLRHLCNFDVVFTCSVLDHIEDVAGIIDELKRIANKSVFLAETNDVPGKFYYPHDYELHGFKKLDYSWKSDADGATYHIWKWTKIQSNE